AEVIISVLLVGGAFALLEQLGALARGAQAIVRTFRGRGVWAIPAVSLIFATFGAMENMQEEIIALVPVLLVLGRGLGVDALTLTAASCGAAAVGAAFGPANPFQSGIALKLAQLPLMSGAALRLTMLAIGLAAWIGWTMRHAMRHRTAPEAPRDDVLREAFSRRDAIMISLTMIAL